MVVKMYNLLLFFSEQQGFEKLFVPPHDSDCQRERQR
jgi:hypothetical protein